MKEIYHHGLSKWMKAHFVYLISIHSLKLLIILIPKAQENMDIKSIFINNLNSTKTNCLENWQSVILFQEKTNLLLKIARINHHLLINKKCFDTKHQKAKSLLWLKSKQIPENIANLEDS